MAKIPQITPGITTALEAAEALNKALQQADLSSDDVIGILKKANLPLDELLLDSVDSTRTDIGATANAVRIIKNMIEANIANAGGVPVEDGINGTSTTNAASANSVRLAVGKFIEDIKIKTVVDAALATSSVFSIAKTVLSGVEEDVILRSDGTTTPLAGRRTTPFIENIATGYKYLEAEFTEYITPDFASVNYYNSLNVLIATYTLTGKRVIPIPKGYKVKICTNGKPVYEVSSVKSLNDIKEDEFNIHASELKKIDSNYTLVLIARTFTDDTAAIEGNSILYLGDAGTNVMGISVVKYDIVTYKNGSWNLDKSYLKNRGVNKISNPYMSKSWGTEGLGGSTFSFNEFTEEIAVTEVDTDSKFINQDFGSAEVKDGTFKVLCDLYKPDGINLSGFISVYVNCLDASHNYGVSVPLPSDLKTGWNNDIVIPVNLLTNKPDNSEYNYVRFYIKSIAVGAKVRKLFIRWDNDTALDQVYEIKGVSYPKSYIDESFASLQNLDKELNVNYHEGTAVPRYFAGHGGSLTHPIVTQEEISNPEGLNRVHKLVIYSLTTGTTYLKNTGILTSTGKKCTIGFWYDYDIAEQIEALQTGAKITHYFGANGHLLPININLIQAVGIETTTSGATVSANLSVTYKLVEKRVVDGRNWAFLSMIVSQTLLETLIGEQDWLFAFNSISQTMKNNSIDFLVSNAIVIRDKTTHITPRIYKDITGFSSLTTKGGNLAGKTLGAVGDSVTYGSVAGTDPITGEMLSYAYYVAKRNDMLWINYGISGSTMQDVAGKNGFSNVIRYQNLSIDLDYILIWFGINDAAYGTLGTIADEDPTASFCGGYNTVLPYLITKHANAKIGIVATYSATDGHRQAVRDLGKKWGLPVLDLYDESQPLVFGRDAGSSIVSSVVTEWRFRYIADSVHLNEDGTKYISTIIEGFLSQL